MSDLDLLERITVNPKVMIGKPVIKGTRLTVEFILNRLGHGTTADELLHEYPGLFIQDIQACHLFASHSESYQSYRSTCKSLASGIDLFD